MPDKSVKSQTPIPSLAHESNYEFEVLCISFEDDDKNVNKKVDNLILRLMGDSTLFTEVSREGARIKDSKTQIELSITQNKSPVGQNPRPILSFLIKSTGGNILIDFRRRLIISLKKESFDDVYILKDTYSAHIGSLLYPHLYKLENQLREYLTLFYAIKIGPSFFKVIATVGQEGKIDKRKNNETYFTEKKAEMGLSFIDFNELGECVYKTLPAQIKQTSDIGTILTEIKELKTDKSDLQEKVKALQDKATSHREKYFTKFTEIGFQKKWEDLYKIRNRIAHNGLFSGTDSDAALGDIQELSEFLKLEINKLIEGTAEISLQDISSIESSILEANYLKITHNEMKSRLIETDNWKKGNSNRFIGLSYFVRQVLGIEGYEIKTSMDIIHNLEEQNWLRINTKKDTSGQYEDIAEIVIL